MTRKRRYGWTALLRMMDRLRGPGGCPWDRRQTHRTLLKYLREETAEVEKAVRRNDAANLLEELGDILLQVVFHARLASERGRFTMADVVDGLARKLVRRHPHVFGKTKLRTAKEVMIQWDHIKRKEKADRARRTA